MFDATAGLTSRRRRFRKDMVDYPCDRPISVLDGVLENRALYILLRYGFRTVREVRETTDAEFLALNGVGSTMLAEIRSVVGLPL